MNRRKVGCEEKSEKEGPGDSEADGSILKTALRNLAQLEGAYSLEELGLPQGNRLEALKGDRISQYSICVNDDFRVCFHGTRQNAYDVEMPIPLNHGKMHQRSSR